MIFESMYFYYLSGTNEILNVGETISYENWIMNKIQEQENNVNILATNAFIHLTCNQLLAQSLPYKIDKIVDFREKIKVDIYNKYHGNISGFYNLYNDIDNYKLNKNIMLNLYNNFCNKVVKYILEHPYSLKSQLTSKEIDKIMQDILHKEKIKTNKD